MREPEPTAEEAHALVRLFTNRGSKADIERVRILIDRCGRYGCVYEVRSKKKPGMSECPGWCSAIEIHERSLAAREGAIERSSVVKPRALTSPEVAAMKRMEAEESCTTEDVLHLDLLTRACREDGCVHEGASPASGITECPGWCTVASDLWLMWWSR